MIYTVTFNPSLDYFVKMKNFELGKTNRTIKEKMQAGGKGINVSLMLEKLGMSSTAIGFTAGFVGDEIQKRLRSAGIIPSFISCEGCSRINVKLEDFEGTEINGAGPVISEENLEELYQKVDAMKLGDVIVLGGSVPKSLPDSIYQKILERLPQTKAGDPAILTVVDTSGEGLRKTLAYHPFLIKPNEDELSELFGREIYFEEDIIEVAQELQRLGARNVLVSMGKRGAVLVCENGEKYTARAPKGKLVNAVGAGDSMVAGFLYGFETFQDYKKAFYYSVASGSASAYSERMGEKELVEELYQGLLESEELQNE